MRSNEWAGIGEGGVGGHDGGRICPPLVPEQLSQHPSGPRGFEGMRQLGH